MPRSNGAARRRDAPCASSTTTRSQTRPYLCGERITIADYFAAQVVHVGSLVGARYEPYPKLQRWLELMKAPPSWSETNLVFDGFAASLADKPQVTLSDAPVSVNEVVA